MSMLLPLSIIMGKRGSLTMLTSNTWNFFSPLDLYMVLSFLITVWFLFWKLFFVLKITMNSKNMLGSHFLCSEIHGEHQVQRTSILVFFLFSRTVFKILKPKLFPTGCYFLYLDCFINFYIEHFLFPAQGFAQLFL